MAFLSILTPTALFPVKTGTSLSLGLGQIGSRSQMSEVKPVFKGLPIMERVMAQWKPTKGDPGATGAVDKA